MSRFRYQTSDFGLHQRFTKRTYRVNWPPVNEGRFIRSGDVEDFQVTSYLENQIFAFNSIDFHKKGNLPQPLNSMTVNP